MLREEATLDVDAPETGIGAGVTITKTPQVQPQGRRRGQRKKMKVADLFCGAGGSSKGAKKALERLGFEMELVAVNHWPTAVETHSRHFPQARHYCQDVSTLRPLAAVPEGFLDLLMASPTCVFHSRARGGRPTSDQQRMDPWHVITWLTELRVKRLLIENVQEFVDWGPVDIRTGKPVPSRKGEYFCAWIRNMEALGYRVKWRIINCADLGDATTRERFFLQARNDGKPIVWPIQTHSKRGASDLFGSGASKWRSARQIIDWNTPGKSLWGRKRGLVSKTIDRTLSGARKFRWPAVYVSALLLLMRQQLESEIAAAEAVLADDIPTDKVARKKSEARRTQAKSTLAYATKRLAKLKEEMAQTQAAGAGQGEPIVVTLRGTEASQVASSSQSVSDPLPTITANGTHIALAEPSSEPFVLGQQSCAAARGVEEPIPTVTTAGFIRLFTPDLKPVVIYVTGGDRPKAPHEVDEPLRTITTHNGAGVVEPTATLVHLKGRSETARVDSPLPTITTHQQLGLATPLVAPYYGEGSGKTCASVEDPLDTVTAKARFALVDADAKPFLVPQFGERPGQEPRNHDIDVPLPAVTSHGAGALVEPALEPIVLQTDQQSSAGVMRSVDDPLQTIVTKRNAAIVAPGLHHLGPDDIAELESLSRQGRLVLVNGRLHVIDIRFRMLNNKELARAMGFDDDESEYEFCGTQSDITRQIGNAVPVHTAAALVHAIMSV